MGNSSKQISNWIDGRETDLLGVECLEKHNPHTGALLSRVINSTAGDVRNAISAASDAFDAWSALTPVKRGEILFSVVSQMKLQAQELAECIAVETGKPMADAEGEVGGAIKQGEFFAGEGMRLYARSLTSGVQGKHSHTIRQPLGVAGLIVPANTPIANIAWKTFPALICGNTVVLKAAEDSPGIALKFAKLAKVAGVPDGVFNVVQGSGQRSGVALVEDPRVALISFTGSTKVGRQIAEAAGSRLARVSLELGGSNPMVVCDDADLDLAVHWASLSAFSNAGQRCAAGSRLLVFEDVFDEFRARFIAKAKSLKLGTGPGCDLGPVVNKRQHNNLLEAIDLAVSEGGSILCGGKAPSDQALSKGYYFEPTVIEGLSPTAEFVCSEVFGPIASLHPVKDLPEALSLSNASEYGLTAAIHTRNVDRAMWFSQRVRAGVANVNFGTYGSEPHMPFGGFGVSGNGTREPGVEALDVYSELKNITFLTRSDQI